MWLDRLVNTMSKSFDMDAQCTSYRWYLFTTWKHDNKYICVYTVHSQRTIIHLWCRYNPTLQIRPGQPSQPFLHPLPITLHSSFHRAHHYFGLALGDRLELFGEQKTKFKGAKKVEIKRNKEHMKATRRKYAKEMEKHSWFLSVGIYHNTLVSFLISPCLPA